MTRRDESEKPSIWRLVCEAKKVSQRSEEVSFVPFYVRKSLLRPREAGPGGEYGVRFRNFEVFRPSVCLVPERDHGCLKFVPTSEIHHLLTCANAKTQKIQI